MEKNIRPETSCNVVATSSIMTRSQISSKNQNCFLKKKGRNLRSKSQPIITEAIIENRRCSSEPVFSKSCSEFENVEIALCKLFENNESNNDILKETYTVSKDDSKLDSDADDLIMDLESPQGDRSSPLMCIEMIDNEAQSNTQPGWGNTYPIHQSKSNGKIPDSVVTSESEKDHQSQEISTTEKNTQMIWDDVLSVTSNKSDKGPQDQPLETSSSSEPCQSKESTKKDKNIHKRGAAPLAEPIIPSKTSELEENEKLLLFLCFHSFELLDFNDDKIWQKINLKKEFKQKSWESYKNDFFSHLVKTIDSYHIPYYFSQHLKQTYGDSDGSQYFTPRNDISASGKLKRKHSYLKDCSSQKRLRPQPSRRHNVDLDVFSSDEYDITAMPLIKQYELYCSRKEKNKRKISNVNCTQGSEHFSCSTNTIPTSQKSKEPPCILEKSRFNNCEKNSINNHNRKKDDSVSGESENESEDDDNPFGKEKFSSKWNRKKNPASQLRRSKQNDSSPDIIPYESDSDSTDIDTSFRQTKETQKDLNVKKRSFLMQTKLTPKKFEPESSDTDTSTSILRPSLTQNMKHGFESDNDTSSIATTSQTNPLTFNLKGLKTRMNYLQYEKEAMVKYLESKKSNLGTIKGNLFWKDMEASDVLPGRTWQSLKNHFFKSLVFELRRYDLNPKFETYLKRCSGKFSS